MDRRGRKYSGVAMLAGSPYISLYLPVSPCISLYLPVSPCISLYPAWRCSQARRSAMVSCLMTSPSISQYLPPGSALGYGLLSQIRGRGKHAEHLMFAAAGLIGASSGLSVGLVATLGSAIAPPPHPHPHPHSHPRPRPRPHPNQVATLRPSSAAPSSSAAGRWCPCSARSHVENKRSCMAVSLCDGPWRANGVRCQAASRKSSSSSGGSSSSSQRREQPSPPAGPCGSCLLVRGAPRTTRSLSGGQG